jgi:hypothetical protein
MPNPMACPNQVLNPADPLYLQGVQGQIFMFQLAQRDRNMQVRFGLKVFWEFRIVDI